MQQITITGYLSRDAEIRSTQSGDRIATWNVPVKQGFGDREQTNWFRVSIWGKRAEFASNARKGEFVAVTGDLTIGEYNGKPQYEIRAVDFQTVKTAPRDDAGGGFSRSAPRDNRADAPVDDLDDAIPFLRCDSLW